MRLVMLKKTLIVFVVISSAFIVYSALIVINANNNSNENINQAMAKIDLQLKGQQLSKEQLSALLKVQDENFYEHSGTDLLSGRMTTLTQALVKKIYFENFTQGIANKYKQSLIAAWVLDEQLSKNEQLDLFLNIAYMGHVNGNAVTGFAEAANIYYQKDFYELSNDEYLSLLVMLDAPNGLNVIKKKNENLAAVNKLKSRLS